MRSGIPDDVLQRLGLEEESPNGDGPKDKEDRRNQADRLIGYALEDAQALFVDQHNAPHGLFDGEPLPLNTRCYGRLRKLMWEREERAVNGEYLKTAAGTLAAKAEFSDDVRELHTRAAWHDGALYYELRLGRVVRVDAKGVGFIEHPPVLFRRFPNLKPLPDPRRGGSVRDLAGYANLKTSRDKRLFTAFAATLPLPHIGRPIFNATGPMGSGKTTLTRLLKRTWDPTAPESVRYDPRDILQKASHAFAVMFDNLSSLPDAASDTACRLVTGEADSKRKLYTDDEDVIVELRRAVLFNGINAPTERGDVLDRMLPVELERIPDGERRTEEEMWERFEAEHPRLLGALFDVLSKAIARKPSLKLSRRPRLADWGEYAASVYEVMGWGAEEERRAARLEELSGQARKHKEAEAAEQRRRDAERDAKLRRTQEEKAEVEERRAKEGARKRWMAGGGTEVAFEGAWPSMWEEMLKRRTMDAEAQAREEQRASGVSRI